MLDLALNPPEPSESLVNEDLMKAIGLVILSQGTLLRWNQYTLLFGYITKLCSLLDSLQLSRPLLLASRPVSGQLLTLRNTQSLGIFVFTYVPSAFSIKTSLILSLVSAGNRRRFFFS